MRTNYQIDIGNPEIVRAVCDMFPRFIDHIPVLEAAINSYFLGSHRVNRALDVAHQLTGTVCKKLLSAAILLASNGYGPSALSIVRSMAEYTINAAYLGNNPGEIEDYLDWVHVQRHRDLQEMLSLGEEWVRESWGADRIASIQAQHSATASRFRGRKDWCRKPLPVRARECGLSKLYAYLHRQMSPLVHGDVVGLARSGQRELVSPERVDVDWSPSLVLVQEALQGAHLCAVIALSVFDHLFELKRQPEVERLLDAYNEIWPGPISKS